MKSIYIVAFLAVLISCKKPLKNVEDYFPKVEFTCEKNADGTVTVKGTIVDEGADFVEGMGFCYSENPEFPITENQILTSNASGIEEKFTGPFDPTKTYYFKFFAANGYGRAESTVLSLTGIESVPVIAPCALNLNSYQINIQNGGITDFGAPVVNVDKVMYPCSGNFLPFMRVTFRTPPLTGLYTTTTNSGVQNGQVKIELSNGSTSVVNDGATVYVNRLSETQFKVEVCDATVNFSGSSFAFKTHFVRNY